MGRLIVRPHFAAVVLFAFLAGRSVPAHADGFGPGTLWKGWFSIKNEVPGVGDFNNDGLDDIVTFLQDQTDSSDGDVYVALSNGSGFGTASLWDTWFSQSGEIPRVGDFDGDGFDDIVTFVQSTQASPGTGDVWVALSTGSQFGALESWHGYFSVGDEIPLVGDFNGDRRDDIITFLRSTHTDGRQGDVYVSLSTGSSFAAASLWHSWFCIGNEVPLVGDFNGDGRDDIVTFLKSTQSGSPEGDVYVALANSAGTGFGASSRWDTWFSPGAEVPSVGDINGDGRDDIITFVKNTQAGVDRNDVWVALSTGSSFGALTQWHESFGAGAELVMSGSFNRDSKADIIDFYRSVYTDSRQGDVYVALSDDESNDVDVDIASTFGYGTMTDRSGFHATGTRPLLVVLMNDASSDPENVPWANCVGLTKTQCQKFYYQILFGAQWPNVRDWFLENSYGSFTFSPAGVAGPYNYPAGSNRRESRVDTFRYAVQAADADVNYRSYDTDGNGMVTTNELTILVVDNRTATKAMASAFSSNIVSENWLHVSTCGGAVGEESPIANFLHELVHCLGQGAEFYDQDDNDGDPPHNKRLTVMAGTTGLGVNDRRVFHLDPFTKMRLGWQRPEVYSLRETGHGNELIDAGYSAARSNGSIILYDPRRGPNEYFILESRRQENYDRDVRSEGIALWWVQTNSSKNPFRIGDFDSMWHLGSPNQVVGGDSLWNASHGTVELFWNDGTSTGAFVGMGDTIASSDRHYIDWGWVTRLAPNVMSGPGTLTRGASARVTGDFTATRGVRFMVLYDPTTEDVPSARREFAVSVTKWTPFAVDFTVPTNVPRGSYRLRAYEDITRVQHGTYLPVVVQ